MSERDYTKIAAQYAELVVAGEVPACEYVVQACQRQIDDLAKFDRGEFSWEWNPELTDIDGIQYRPAERICKFIELLPHAF